VAASEPYDHAQINGPYFATLQIITVRHDLRCKITVERRRRSIGTTVLVNLLASLPSLEAGGACVLYVPSVNRPKPILRPIGQGWKNSYIKDYRSNGLVNKLRRTIGQSVLQTNHIASLKDYRSNGLVNKL